MKEAKNSFHWMYIGIWQVHVKYALHHILSEGLISVWDTCGQS